MAKVPCKGTTLKQTIASVLTAVAQVISLELSGSESETYESRTLDGGVYIPYDQTGYSEGGEVAGELFYDPALAGHIALRTLIKTPAKNAMNVTYADVGATVQAFTVAGVGLGITVDMASGLKGKFKLKIDGDAGW